MQEPMLWWNELDGSRFQLHIVAESCPRCPMDRRTMTGRTLACVGGCGYLAIPSTAGTGVLLLSAWWLRSRGTRQVATAVLFSRTGRICGPHHMSLTAANINKLAMLVDHCHRGLLCVEGYSTERKGMKRKQTAAKPSDTGSEEAKGEQGDEGGKGTEGGHEEAVSTQPWDGLLPDSMRTFHQRTTRPVLRPTVESLPSTVEALSLDVIAAVGLATVTASIRNMLSTSGHMMAAGIPYYSHYGGVQTRQAYSEDNTEFFEI